MVNEGKQMRWNVPGKARFLCPEQTDVRTQAPANWEQAVVAALAELGETSGAASGADRLRIFCRFRRRRPDRRGRHAGRCIGCNPRHRKLCLHCPSPPVGPWTSRAPSSPRRPSPPRPPTTRPPPGEFRQRCEIVANTYLLSRRESEVMYYLARGYKSSHIQQQLYISEGTAKTHIRHIYRKLNIHSQQDLIHLIDEVEL